MFFAIDQHRVPQHILQHGGVMGGMQHDNGNGMSMPFHFVPSGQPGMEGQHQQQQQQQQVPGRLGGWKDVPNSVPGGMPFGEGMGQGTYPTGGIPLSSIYLP